MFASGHWSHGRCGGIVVVAAGFMLGLMVQAILLLYTSQKNHFIPYSYSGLFLTMIVSTVFAFGSLLVFNTFNPVEFMMIAGSIGLMMLSVLFFILLNENERTKILKYLFVEQGT